MGFIYEFGDKISMTTYRDINAAGDVTRWLRDEATGLVTNKVYADGKGPRYDYTPDGKLATRTWARGIVTTYSYDDNGSLTNTVYSDGTPTISLAYNRAGRQIEAHDAAGITICLYDDFGSLTNETVVGVAGTNTIERFHDSFGRDAGYALNGVRQSTLAYDLATGRLATMLANGSDAPFTWSYLPGSDLKSSLEYPNGHTASWQYDANGQLLQVCNAFPTNIISQYGYTYDAAGRRVEITRSGSAMSETRTDVYGYNIRNELISAAKSGGSSSSTTEYAYQYDDIGNRITSFDLGTNRVYMANNLNQYTSISNLCDSLPAIALAETGAGEVFSPQYDDDGNQTLIKTATGVWSVTYNGENRPVLWECGSTNIVMKFDRMGRRVEYVDTVNGSTNAHHRFVYDGYICIQRFNAASRNAIDLVISWDPSEPVATRPLILQKYGQYNLFYTHDGNKNVSELVFLQQANGIAAHYEYAPFGAVTTTSRSTPVTAYDFCEYNPFRFSSEYAEGVLRLVYYNYRHYTSIYGRWIVRDPVEDYTKDAAYSYCNNIPTTLFDVLGLRTKIVNGVIFCRTSRPREGYAPTVNGCGSGWNTYLVPDRDYSIIGYLFDVDFKVACNKHDACYGTCAENKATCDTNLYNGMIQECDKIPNLFFTEKARCYAMAKTFYFAVDKLGDGPFESAQDDACEWECCGMINYGRQDFINAYPEF